MEFGSFVRFFYGGGNGDVLGGGAKVMVNLRGGFWWHFCDDAGNDCAGEWKMKMRERNLVFQFIIKK